MKKLLALSLIILFVSCQKEPEVTPNTNPSIVVNERTSLNTILTPLKKAPLELDNADLKVFDDLKSVPIVGLGEATHGTKEFFEMKHRLFKYFVENFNHKIFAFEMDYGESLIFDDYVQTGNGDLEQLMKTKMLLWTWNTVEMKNLLEWMKNYNQSKLDSDKIHIYGVDCAYFTYNVPEVIKRVSYINPKLSDSLTHLIGTLSSYDYRYKGEKHDDIVQAKRLISENKSIIVAKSSLKEFLVIEHLVDIISQTDDYLIDYSTNPNSFLRDKYMAENVIWLSEHSSYPMSIWAHNGHIINDRDYNRMGSFLTQKYQEKYQKIGFSFAEGTATALNLKTNKLSYNTFPSPISLDFANSLLSQASTPNYVIKMSDIFKDNKLSNYFLRHPLYQIGALYNDQLTTKNFLPLQPSHFNYLIHINNSTHSDCYNVTP